MTAKRDVRAQFGANADAYVTSQIHKEGVDLKKLIEIAQLTGNEIALDIATGGGHTANALAPYVSHVTALDLTPAILASAKAFIDGNGHRNVHFIEGDAESLPFKDASFDIVTCRIASHHFPDVQRFTQEVFRVLRPDGQFLLDDNIAPENDRLDHFYNTVEKERDFSHFRAWKKTEWIRMIEESGFTIMEWHRVEKTFLYDSWCNRMKLSETKKEALNQYMLTAPDSVKKTFAIEEGDNKVVSFRGEAFVMKAVKRL